MTEQIIPVRSLDQLYESIHERMLDLQERKNRGALIVRVVKPLEDEEVVDRGDVIEVVAQSGKLKDAEVIYANQIMAFHPEYGILPCIDILAEIIDPDRMTIDDFEDLYGEEEDADSQEAEELGPICECGEDRSDCQLSQETFGIHANASYEE